MKDSENPRTKWIDGLGDICSYHAGRRNSIDTVRGGLKFLAEELQKTNLTEELRECLQRNIERITDNIHEHDKHLYSQLLGERNGRSQTSDTD